MKSEMKSQELLPKRWFGFLSIVIGILLFYSLPMVAASLSVFASWILLWPILGMTGLGGLLLLDLELMTSLKVMAFSLVVLFPWSRIFYLHHPSDFQGLLAVFVAGIIGLLIRQYYLKHKPDKQDGISQPSVKLTSKGKSEKNSLPSYKALLLLFIAVCGLAVVAILGVMPLLIDSPKESARHFKETELDYLYEIQVDFIPSQAFVFFEDIEVDVSIQLRFYNRSFFNGVNITGLTLSFPYTCYVMTDMHALEMINGHLEIELKEPQQGGSGVTIINAWEKGTICYESEGTFDMILTVEHPSHDDEFIFPDVVEIKPYDHLEQLNNIQLTRSLVFMILGLLIISTIPAIDRLISAFFHPD